MGRKMNEFLSNNFFGIILKNLSRRKPQPTTSPRGFSRCLSTFELTSLGIGAILGAGIYVVAGQVASTIAGPSTFLSFLIAAIASLLSGLAYAEFGARVPRTTGSAYAYSYVAVGEIWAFIIGWNLILEYMIGTAADASALSASVENLASSFFGNLTYIFSPIPPIIGSNRPDLLAFLFTISITALLAIGVRDSSTCTLVCNIINVMVIIFIVFYGSFYADISRWKGYNNFFPFGIGGTLSGAAACFYAFVGFDIIATTGEEAEDASKSIPIAIVASLIFVLIGYLSISIVITMMVPYYSLDDRAPLASAFERVGKKWAGTLISSGATFGLTSSLIGSLFPLPRIVYAMANDGLLFNFLSKIHGTTEIPINATIYSGLITAFFTLFLNLQELVEMMSIGTLLAYTIVSYCILILRYQPSQDYYNNTQKEEYDVYNFKSKNTKELSKSLSKLSLVSNITNISQLISTTPTTNSCIIAIISSSIIFLCFLCLATLVLFFYENIISKNIWAILLLVILCLIIIISYIILSIQPQNQDELSFKAPFVPLLPILAILFNIFLILKLSLLTWVRFTIWMTIGFMLYIFYSYRSSKLHLN